MPRTMLHLLILVATIALAVLIWAGFKSYCTLAISKETSLPFDLDSTYKEIFYYASLAPSSHNAQMWQVQYQPQQAIFSLWLDPKRTLAIVDSANRESYISLGTFLENARQAATAHGMASDIEIINRPVHETGQPANEPVAYIRFMPMTSHRQNDAHTLQTMERRHTDKRTYNEQEIPAHLLQQLLQNHSGYLHYYPRSSVAYAYLANATVQAMAQQANEQAKRDELALWLRFSDQEALMTRDGLPAEQLGILGLKKFFYYLFVDRQAARGAQFAQQSIALTTQQVAACSGFFVITGGSMPSDLVKTGMNLENFWLDATKHNISIHPMSQILEESPYAHEVLQQLQLEQPVQMVLRAGFVNGDYGSNQRIRRSLDNFLYLSSH